MIRALSGKSILLGVCGGIACYKAVELLRILMKEGAEVSVAMSGNAHRFVTPLTFQALSGRPVYQHAFESDSAESMEHIAFANKADLLVIAPATANTIGKMANGLADSALTNLFMAFEGAVVIAPAMNTAMYGNPAVKANIALLKGRGAKIVEPGTGELACGAVGAGRLAELEDIMDSVHSVLNRDQCFKGLKALVTAGPTREFIDPVRYISNPSSGKMGYAIAEAFRDRGARVDLVSGPVRLEKPYGIEVSNCVTATEMHDCVHNFFPDCDILVMTAAVGDFAPKSVRKEKMKKQGKKSLNLELQATVDILKSVAQKRTKQYIVGFAAETENLIESAKEKLVAKDVDMIVANDISAPGIGFQSNANQVSLVLKNGEVVRFPRADKRDIADALIDRIKEELKL